MDTDIVNAIASDIGLAASMPFIPKNLGSIINSGIKRVVYEQGYPDPFTLELFEEAGVRLEKTSGGCHEISH